MSQIWKQIVLIQLNLFASANLKALELSAKKVYNMKFQSKVKAQKNVFTMNS